MSDTWFALLVAAIVVASVIGHWRGKMTITNGLFTSDSDEWETPQSIFEPLNEKYRFTLDPCSTDVNAKCEKHYTVADDGLSKSWAGERVFVNPPYGRKIAAWVDKCHKESEHAIVIALLPARTDTAWFHNHVYGKAQVRFLRGRVKFERGGVAVQSAPFPSMLVRW